MFNNIINGLKNITITIGLSSYSYLYYIPKYADKITENVYYYNLNLDKDYTDKLIEKIKELSSKNKNIDKFINNQIKTLIFKDAENIDIITDLNHIYQLKLDKSKFKISLDNLNSICSALEATAQEDNFNVNLINNYNLKPNLNQIYFLYDLEDIFLTKEYVYNEKLFLNNKQKNKAPIGFKNLGNTCFINALLQSLLNLDLLKNKAKKIKTEGNSLSKKFINFFINQNNKYITKEIWKLDNFKKYQFGDSDELLTQLLDNCEEIKDFFNIKISSCIYIGELEVPLNNSIVSKLEIPLNEKEIQDINLDLYFESTIDEYLYNGKKFKDLKSITKIEEVPEILTIHLKRFSNNGDKIYHTVNFPFSLNIEKYLKNNGLEDGLNYKLKSVIMHHGKARHYSAYVNKNNSWYHCNDDKISKKLTKDEVKDIFMPEKISQVNPYILFYVKENKKNLNQKIDKFINKNVIKEELKEELKEKLKAVISERNNLKNLKNTTVDLIKDQADGFFIKLNPDLYNKKEIETLHFYYQKSIISLIKLKNKFPFLTIICDKDINQDHIRVLQKLHSIFIKPYQDQINKYIKNKI